jgi:hypothetical protein
MGIRTVTAASIARTNGLMKGNVACALYSPIPAATPPCAHWATMHQQVWVKRRAAGKTLTRQVRCLQYHGCQSTYAKVPRRSNHYYHPTCSHFKRPKLSHGPTPRQAHYNMERLSRSSGFLIPRRLALPSLLIDTISSHRLPPLSRKMRP